MAYKPWAHKFEKRTADGYRSKSEQTVARLLTGAGIPFEYEDEQLKYVLEHSYTPDFNIRIAGKTIRLEVKGYWESSDRTKMKTVLAQNPGELIVMVFDNPNNKLNKTSKTSYAKWCEDRGIPWVARADVVEFVKALLEE